VHQDLYFNIRSQDFESLVFFDFLFHLFNLSYVMGLQIKVLALIQRLRAIVSKAQQRKAESNECDRFIQDSITERQRYDQARRKRMETTQPHNAGIQVATTDYSHPQSLFRSNAT
jgi:hypothetical protein